MDNVSKFIIPAVLIFKLSILVLWSDELIGRHKILRAESRKALRHMVESPGSGLTEKQQQILRLLHAARRSLAPDMTAAEYFKAVKDFEIRQRGRVENRMFRNQTISAGDAARMPDNSEKYETLEYRCNGLDKVAELLGDGKPVAFVGWHHGARDHAEYALARTLPDIAIFTRWVVQYGKVFSILMGITGGLGLVKMKRFLDDLRPIFYFLDGAPGGECVELPIIGINCNFSIAPIRMFRSVAGLRIVPVTKFYIDETGVELNFLAALGADDKLAEMDEPEILAALLARLEQDQRKRGPAQVLINSLPHREQLAREMADRRKTI